MEKQTIEESWNKWANETFTQENIEQADFDISNLLAKQRLKENKFYGRIY